MTRLQAVSVVILICLASTVALAGGPNLVGGPAIGTRPAFGTDGRPFTWNPANMPIRYRLDPGPMAATRTGTVVVSNATGAQRVQSMVGVWQGVSTAEISFANAGPLLATTGYVGGDVKSAAQFNALVGSCKSGVQNPVIFDADGTLMQALGLPFEVIGLTSVCSVDSTAGYITSGLVLLNGKYQDGVTDFATSNFELTANEFDEAITHEIGHLIGLDHSQINVDVITTNAYPCDLDTLAGLPLMFPFAMCQARKDAGLPTLAPDDKAWLSKLYPSSAQAGAYGVISGVVLFSDGKSHFQGANVIARQVDDPSTPEDESRRVAVSALSGFLFTGNPGQSVTAVLPDATENNIGGSPDGSRNPQLIGYYEIPVPPGTYTIEVEPVYLSFEGGSGIGPLPKPVRLAGDPEFWNRDESAFDFPMQRDTITVHAGDRITDVDIILNLDLMRFDYYEDEATLFDVPAPLVKEAGREA